MTGRGMALLACLPGLAAAERCDALLQLKMPDTNIMAAERILAGAMADTSSPQTTSLYPRLPAFCRVQAVMRPSSDSEIKTEVWMPESGWNGKMLGVGGGGYAWQMPRLGMVQPVLQGYAAASTDTGHEGHEGDIMSADFALGHPERVIDYAYRAVHEMTVKAKVAIASYYGKGPRFSYFVGCSLGGEQGLKEAQRYPTDYDGISAGSPTYDRTHLHAWQVYLGQEALKGDKAKSLPEKKYGPLHSAVLAACDELDGVKDGILSDPRQCRFDATELKCRDGDRSDCLTDAQVEMVRQMYAPVVDSRTGRAVYPGLAYGSELGWRSLIGGAEPFGLGVQMFKYLVHQDPSWDWRRFDLSHDIEAADRQYKGTLQADDPDLTAFRARGGKLLLWHGWSDPAVPPQGTIDYYERVANKAGARVQDFVRLFLVPGMYHCSGGPGANQFNSVAALERWVEAGIAPDRILAVHAEPIGGGLAGLNGFGVTQVEMTRPLCPYPQVAQWRGIGTPNDAENFVCQLPVRTTPAGARAASK